MSVWDDDRKIMMSAGCLASPSSGHNGWSWSWGVEHGLGWASRVESASHSGQAGLHTQREKISKSSVLSHNGTGSTPLHHDLKLSSPCTDSVTVEPPAISLLTNLWVRQECFIHTAAPAPGKLCIPSLVCVRVNHEWI